MTPDVKHVVKTRLQLQRKAAGPSHYRGITDTLLQIVRNEGPSRLYRGIAPLLLLEAPKRAIKFGANDFWGKTFRDFFQTKEKTQSLSLLTGCFAGATESLIVVPFELVKIRLQDKSQAHLYHGPADVVRAIVKQSGWSGLYNGIGSTMIRHVLWNGGYFASIFKIQQMLPKAENRSEAMRNSLISGTTGGFIGTVLNTPADVIKTRIQNADRVPGVAPKYRGTFSGMLLILREEGPAALYKGFAPKAVTEEARRFLGPPYI
ncbi:uncharacterized protein MJAP1_002091 [Malassezia japonica]|uniref:Mitochondrial carrier n=1 Tax=Malassezia japonica TaxID=223818 RepID=A0AAF0JAC7_9BASI|nr:uncharacterized protein MJAP1_002091 [Malassezia japonica]WFD39120.1 hypothetical protein MJAP1_002091 [Malassezia japonica]